MSSQRPTGQLAGPPPPFPRGGAPQPSEVNPSRSVLEQHRPTFRQVSGSQPGSPPWSAPSFGQPCEQEQENGETAYQPVHLQEPGRGRTPRGYGPGSCDQRPARSPRRLLEIECGHEVRRGLVARGQRCQPIQAFDELED